MLLAVTTSGWLGQLARAAANDPKRKRSCILLWMSGGPSTIDLWDLKPEHANGGPYKEIATKAPGLKIGEHLPKMAEHADRFAIIFELVVLALFLVFVGSAARPVMSGHFAPLFWGGLVVVGLLTPLVLEFVGHGARMVGAVSAVLVLIGGFVLRYVMVMSIQS